MLSSYLQAAREHGMHHLRGTAADGAETISTCTQLWTHFSALAEAELPLATPTAAEVTTSAATALAAAFDFFFFLLG